MLGKSLDELLAERPVDRIRVDMHKKHMVDEARPFVLGELREASGLTRADIARQLHVNRNQVSRIENGDIEKTRVNTLRKFVEALGGKLHIEIELGEERIQIT